MDREPHEVEAMLAVDGEHRFDCAPGSQPSAVDPVDVVVSAGDLLAFEAEREEVLDERQDRGELASVDQDLLVLELDRDLRTGERDARAEQEVFLSGDRDDEEKRRLRGVEQQLAQARAGRALVMTRPEQVAVVAPEDRVARTERRVFRQYL